MVSLGQAQRIVRFGAFELDVRSGELRKQGLKTRLTPQSCQVLLLLVERAGDVVAREELRQKLWPADTFVDFDMGLSSAVKKLRDALGDSAENPRFVETLPRRGYRFITPVDKPAALAQEEPPAGGMVLPGGGLRLPWARSGAMAVAALAAVGLAVGGTWEWLRGRAAPAQIRSLAVLPFENLTGHPDQDYFVDGVTETLTTNLAQLRALRVISRTSAMQYRRAKKSLPQIAHELDVDGVVEGAVGRSGDRVRVTAQLIDARTDRHVWARSYDREQRDVLALQAELAQAIADAVRVEVRAEERQLLARARPVEPAAYDAYLKGRFYWSQRRPENLLRAVAQFEEAIKQDPAYAPAYSGLSDTYRLFDMNGLAAPRQCMPKALAFAQKALALDDSLAEAHASLAGVLYRYNWEWARAEQEFQRSLEQDPNYAEGYRAYGVYLLTLRRPEEGVRALRRAAELSPLSPVVNTELGTALDEAGRYDEAIAQLDKTLAMDPSFARASGELARVYVRKGDLAQAIAVIERRAERLPPHAAIGTLRGYLYAVTGRRDEALRILKNREKLAQDHYVSPQASAIVYLGLGQKDRALALLEKAYEERAFDLLGLSVELFDLLQDEPRFRDLLRRIGLEGYYYPGSSRAARR